jgi:putative Ca2+/H+ antiporter (TMEM165/GDT1 family)
MTLSELAIAIGSRKGQATRSLTVETVTSRRALDNELLVGTKTTVVSTEKGERTTLATVYLDKSENISGVLIDAAAPFGLIPAALALLALKADPNYHQLSAS